MRWLAALLLCLVANVAQAQNPTCPTRPLTDSSNACASTAFVQGVIAGGVGIVNSVTNADGTLTIAPTTGAVVSSLNIAHANTWTGVQNFTATGNSIPLIGQGANTTVTALTQPATPATGRAYAIAGQIQGNGSGGQKVGVYGAAQNGVGNADQVWGGNFLAQWDVVTDVAVQGVEIDLNNNQSNTFTLAKNGLSINSGGSNQGGIAVAVASTTGSNRWNVGYTQANWNTAGIVLGGPTNVAGAISAKQLTNGADTVILQRTTDTTPTGQLLRAVNAANSANLFILDVAGNITNAGIVTAGTNGGAAGGAIVLNGITSSSAQIAVSATGGHLTYANSGSAPTLTAGCNGGGSAISGTDISGTVTGQTAAATSCTVTFGTAFGATPRCTPTGRTTPVTSYTPGTGTLVINFASTASAVFDWTCYGT
jgi:hypothetical protein